MKYLKAITAVTTLVAACVCASLLWAEPLSPEQQKTIKTCTQKYYDDINRCTREHPNLPYQDCANAADAGYRVCMKSAGLLSQHVPPSKLPLRPKGMTHGLDERHPQTAPATATPVKGLKLPGGIDTKVDATTRSSANSTATPKPKPSGTPRGERKG